MGLAKLLEDKCNASKTYFKKGPTFPNPHTPQSFTKPLTVTLSVKRLTPTEMVARREKGLYFNCDEKFVPGHRCRPAQFLCLMIEQEDDEKEATFAATEVADTKETPEEDVTHIPQISFHAFTGQAVPSTLKLARSINEQPMVVLIDGGSSNNFI